MNLAIIAMIQKKQREGRLNASQNVHDIFAEQLSFPDCVDILINCIKECGEADCRNL